MSTPQVRQICRVILGRTHKSTGKTRHLRDGRSLPDPVELRIVWHAGDPGYYLSRLDAAGGELADTYHESLDDAQAQAEGKYVRGNFKRPIAATLPC